MDFRSSARLHGTPKMKQKTEERPTAHVEPEPSRVKQGCGLSEGVASTRSLLKGLFLLCLEAVHDHIKPVGRRHVTLVLVHPANLSHSNVETEVRIQQLVAYLVLGFDS